MIRRLLADYPSIALGNRIRRINRKRGYIERIATETHIIAYWEKSS